VSKDTERRRRTPDAGASPKLLRRLVVSLLVLVVAIIWSFRSMSPDTPGTQVGLDEALRLASQQRVAEATFFDQDARAVLRLADAPTAVWVAYPGSGGGNATLLAAMVQGGAQVRVDQQWGKRTVGALAQYILPLLLLANLFGIFILLSRGGGGSQVRELFAFSRVRARRANPQASTTRFREVAAADEAIEELAEVRDYLKDPTRFAAMGALPPKGVLLFGPPGCGKTLLARALAGEAGVPFYFLSGSEFVESLVGVGAARVRDLFKQARATAPCIIFVDELDAAGRRRGAGLGGGHDEREQTLNEMLVQMDGFSPSSGIVVIGATNRPDILDPALLRPGRFDRHVGMDLPDLRGRMAILALHARTRKVSPGASLEEIARLTPGFTGADLANVVNEAALLAVRRGGTEVTTDDLVEGVDRAASGPKKRGRVLAPEELQRLAYHEAGHVVVAANVDAPVEVHRVSLVARGRNAAHAGLRPADRTVLTRGELIAELTTLMAGLAAEVLILGEPSTAAESDIERATDLARRFAGTYGMADGVGRIRVLQKETEVFLGRDYLAAQHLSGEMLARVDQAVGRLVEEAERRALELLQRRRASLDAVAQALMERETLNEADVKELLAIDVALDFAPGDVAPRQPAAARGRGARRASR
jgi:cell division protease FtsH